VRLLLATLLAACTASETPQDSAPPDAGDDTVDCTDTATPDTRAPEGADTPEVPPDTTAPPGPVEPGAELVLYAVRHAEKESEGEDPGLTEEGLARAEALAERMRDVPLTAIYATDLVRTQLTVAPTAEAHGLPVETSFDPEDALALHLLCTHGGDTVLHAGHSYTLPDLFDALGVTDDLDVSGYGQLFVLRVAPDESVTAVEEHFGE
jgi:phosphohistidine phosphatase SixA